MKNIKWAIGLLATSLFVPPACGAPNRDFRNAASDDAAGSAGGPEDTAGQQETGTKSGGSAGEGGESPVGVTPEVDAGAGGEAGSVPSTPVTDPMGGACVPDAARCSVSPERREACNAAGEWTIVETCPTGSLCQGEGASCLKPDGGACAGNLDCITGVCGTFHADLDGDTYGSNLAADSVRICGAAAPAGYVTNSDDCCDKDKNAKPGQSVFFEVSNNCDSFDYNCSGSPDVDPLQKHVAAQACNLTAQTCSTPAGWVGMQQTTCGSLFYWATSCVYVAVESSCTWVREQQKVRCH